MCAKEDGVAEMPAGGTSGALIPVVTHDLSQGLREIRSRVIQEHRRQKERVKEEESQMRVWQQEFLAEAPTIFPGVPPDVWCSSAAPGAAGLQGYMRWFPPCVEFAKAMGFRNLI